MANREKTAMTRFCAMRRWAGLREARFDSRSTACKRFVVGGFTLLLFLRVEPRAVKGGLNGTGVPVGDRAGDLIVNP